MLREQLKIIAEGFKDLCDFYKENAILSLLPFFVGLLLGFLFAIGLFVPTV